MEDWFKVIISHSGGKKQQLIFVSFREVCIETLLSVQKQSVIISLQKHLDY